MQCVTVGNLIYAGVLLKEEKAADLERDGFVSYVVAEGYVLQTRAQRDNSLATVNYVQVYSDAVDGPYWVLQLERLPEDPNNLSHRQSDNFAIYKSVDI